MPSKKKEIADVKGRLYVNNPIKSELNEHKLDLLKTERSSKLQNIIAFASVVCLLIIASIFFNVMSKEDDVLVVINVIFFITGVFLIGLLIVAILQFVQKNDQMKNMQEKLSKDNKSISTDTDFSAHFDTLVSINLKNLADYYELVKNSNRKSFNAALWVSVAGFMIIAGGLITSYFGKDAKEITYLASAAGIIVEIVSGLMFYLYSRTILQLKEYHDSLLNVQNMLLSFKLFTDHKSENDSSEILQQMIGHLLNSTVKKHPASKESES